MKEERLRGIMKEERLRGNPPPLHLSFAKKLLEKNLLFVSGVISPLKRTSNAGLALP
jgi:hypothetical protein